MANVKKFCFLALLATLLPGCKSGTREPESAVLALSVSPVPLIVKWACPVHAPTDPPPERCMLTMDPTITITESAGVGGQMVSMAVSVRDLATQAEKFIVVLDHNWIIANTGGDRVEPRTAKSFHVVVQDYPLPFSTRPNLTLVMGARMVDDKGNEITPGLRVDIP